jgi:hypothetical protein
VTLPTDADARKGVPLYRAVLRHFPDALAEIARAAVAGEKQHDLSDLAWDRERSTDHADALVRHLIEHGTRDSDGVRHSAKLAWRALALLQIECERDDRPGAVRVVHAHAVDAWTGASEYDGSDAEHTP